MNGQDLFRGMNYVNLEFIEEAETVTQLKGEKKILSLRFFAGRTQVEVAKEVGISQAQVSRLEKGALDKIKREL